VRLNGFTLAGDAVSCGKATAQTILPGGSVRCLLRKNVTTQQLADAGQLLLAYPVTVTAAGQMPGLLSTPLNTSSMSLSKLIGASPACNTCRDCMRATQAFVQSLPVEASAAMIASAFGTACGQQAPLCSKVQADISASTFGNLGRRAAGMCFALELCDRKLGASCTMQVSLNTSAGVQMASVSAASLDVCSGGQHSLRIWNQSEVLPWCCLCLAMTWHVVQSP
jgi:hypothetical protein